MLNNRPDPFFRNQGAIDAGEQQQLIRSTVAVCGCGGLGGLVIENLARIGVGRLRIADPDFFSVSNLNRQLGATRKTLGKNKAEAMAARIREISDHCRVEPLPRDFRETDIPRAADVAVDCLDNGAARLELAGRCRQLQVPLVHGAVNGWYGQVCVQAAGSDLVQMLYGNSTQEAGAVPVLPFTATLVASLQAAETVKLLLGRPSSLENRWLSIDLLAGDFEYSG